LTDLSNQKISLSSLASSPQGALLGGNVEFTTDTAVAITRPRSIPIPISFGGATTTFSRDQARRFYDPSDNLVFGNYIFQKVHELNESGADIYVSGHIRGGSYRLLLDSY
jgi:hypothetical protein